MALVSAIPLQLSLAASTRLTAEASPKASTCRPCGPIPSSSLHCSQPSLQPAQLRRHCIGGRALPKRRNHAAGGGVSRRQVAPTQASVDSAEKGEVVYFDGGPHVGDLVVNLVFGLSVLWLPLTLASVARAFFLRYRFTNKRVTVLSGLTGDDRKDFSYAVVKDVKCVPRFIGEWGDILIELSDGTKVDLGAVPKFREIVAYTLKRAEEEREGTSEEALAAAGKGFSKA